MPKGKVKRDRPRRCNLRRLIPKQSRLDPGNFSGRAHSKWWEGTESRATRAAAFGKQQPKDLSHPSGGLRGEQQISGSHRHGAERIGSGHRAGQHRAGWDV